MHEVAVEELCGKLDKTIDCILHEPTKKAGCLASFKAELEATLNVVQKVLVTEMFAVLYEGDMYSLQRDLGEIFSVEGLKTVPVFPPERASALRNLVVCVKDLLVDGRLKP